MGALGIQKLALLVASSSKNTWNPGACADLNGLPGGVKLVAPLVILYVVIYNSAYPLLFDFNPRFWHSLCTYALSTEVNDEGNSKTEMGRKNDAVNFALIYKLI